MFQPVDLGLQIFRDRYAIHPEETWAEACERVARHVAGAEEGALTVKWRERFRDELENNRFMAGGRTWYGSGRSNAQLINCYVCPTEDSREGWGKALYDVIVVSGTGGGVGLNMSPIRPRGAEIKGTGGKATGAVSLMQMVDRVGDVLVSGGGRRLALMLALDVDHPDIEEFLSVKLQLDQLTNANISVLMTIDAVKFQELVRTDGEIPLRFGGRESGRSINARRLWQTLVENAWKSGEPGVLNLNLANKMSNIWYHKPIIAYNPCGEQPLERYGACCLGSLVLPRFAVDGQLDWDALDSSIRSAVRFLDNVLTVNNYPLPEIKENCSTVRRIGLGVMGLHSLLLELGKPYGQPAGNEFIDQLFSFIKNTAYDASINLAIEKGPFPAYDGRLLDSGFSKTLKRGIRNKIKEHGLRNAAVLTVAPTGTTSMVAGVTSGVEPLFAPAYIRRFYKPTDDGSRELAQETVVTPEFLRWGELAVGAYDLTPRQHFEVQRIVQQHIDSAVSKTINLPADYPVEELSDLWLEYLPTLKGCTFYRAGSRGFEPLEAIPVSEAQSGGLVEFNAEDQAAMDCPDGVCVI